MLVPVEKDQFTFCAFTVFPSFSWNVTSPLPTLPSRFLSIPQSQLRDNPWESLSWLSCGMCCSILYVPRQLEWIMYLVCGNYLFIDLFLTVLGALIVICAFLACSEDLIDVYQISRWVSLLSSLSLTQARVFVLFCVCLGQVAENNPHSMFNTLEWRFWNYARLMHSKWEDDFSLSLSLRAGFGLAKMIICVWFQT